MTKRRVKEQKQAERAQALARISARAQALADSEKSKRDTAERLKSGRLNKLLKGVDFYAGAFVRCPGCGGEIVETGRLYSWVVGSCVSCGKKTAVLPVGV